MTTEKQWTTILTFLALALLAGCSALVPIGAGYLQCVATHPDWTSEECILWAIANGYRDTIPAEDVARVHSDVGDRFAFAAQSVEVGLAEKGPSGQVKDCTASIFAAEATARTLTPMSTWETDWADSFLYSLKTCPEYVSLRGLVSGPKENLCLSHQEGQAPVFCIDDFRLTHDPARVRKPKLGKWARWQHEDAACSHSYEWSAAADDWCRPSLECHELIDGGAFELAYPSAIVGSASGSLLTWHDQDHRVEIEAAFEAGEPRPELEGYGDAVYQSHVKQLGAWCCQCATVKAGCSPDYRNACGLWRLELEGATE